MTDRIEDNLKFVRYAMRGVRGRAREDMAADGRLALAEAYLKGKRGEDLLRKVQHACRTSARREWRYDSKIAFSAPSFSPGKPDGEFLELWDAVKTLPSRQYLAVFLTYWGGMSDEEVAIEMGITSQAVDTLLQKAYKKIKKCVGGWNKHPLAACI
jgi:RNA polymerase sigma factor (sigma-70 family)